MIYMICYDITSPKRLRKTARVLESFGLRIQKSFFQCDISPDKLKILKEKMLQEIDRKYDRLYIYPLCIDCSEKAITDGTGVLLRLEDFEIL